MSENNAFGFAKLVPGFDFLQGLAKGAADKVPQLPNLSNWVAPTINVEELEKRITELKSVQFWLEQNSRALAATIQALEVQKMTLATLQGMNFNMADVANAFKLKAADTVATGVQKAGETVASAAQAVSDVAARAADGAEAASTAAAPAARKSAKAAPEVGAIDPLQWWGALTSQFQQIAATALNDAARQGALDATKSVATGLAKEALKTATDMATQIAAKGVQTMQEAAGVKPAAAAGVGAAVKTVAQKAASEAGKKAASEAVKAVTKTARKAAGKAPAKTTAKVTTKTAARTPAQAPARKKAAS
ncbi:hypothetical protein G7045_11630 [Acidovorax sp. HDW3]|uniref:PhaM family polyhydroxyalkanoate granule multifunctional regulatory protein n=1 Tax=Acidovorax sp. HDW3 TaxID=2714923 RepID=UPI00140E199F|nr:PhaM family polyhydroxyalkanoate granule multifunctional regulatory protein [Acidovorax sp. HDW3]QIL44864.1 hypothetical protein G7045_11630 [Acidovorax sp. HDW3]